MANLMLTTQCNLNCRYCFANEFVNKQRDEMSFENFMWCLKFLSVNPKERIGLIGGEPTLHPQLKEMLAAIIDSPFESACLFSNGILINQYFNELRNSKFQILINLNDPKVIGETNYQKIMSNMDEMINHLYMKEQVSFGLNLYYMNQDYTYILDALKRFKQKKLRVSVSVPNIDFEKKVNSIKYFKSMMPVVRRLMKDIIEIGVAPNFDCNYIPRCILTSEDEEFLKLHCDVMQYSNIYKMSPICSPVIDILPDLQVVRCFGMSDLYKVDIRDFDNSKDLRRHFLFEVDALAYHILPTEECENCKDYRAGKCSCGCYAYRMKKLKQLRKKIERNEWC